MKYDDLINLLSDKEKQRLAEAKTQEDLDRLFTAEMWQLSEDQLGSVAGGTSCFTPDPMRTYCLNCGQYIPEADYWSHVVACEQGDGTEPPDFTHTERGS